MSIFDNSWERQNFFSSPNTSEQYSWLMFRLIVIARNLESIPCELSGTCWIEFLIAGSLLCRCDIHSPWWAGTCTPSISSRFWFENKIHDQYCTLAPEVLWSSRLRAVLHSLRWLLQSMSSATADWITFAWDCCNARAGCLQYCSSSTFKDVLVLCQTF